MEKKRQHYVPKFYLRCFSKNDKLINAYHLKSNKILENISLKRQCYEDYFNIRLYFNFIKIKKKLKKKKESLKKSGKSFSDNFLPRNMF